MKDVDSITVYVNFTKKMDDDDLLEKTGINMDRIKILRMGSGFEYTPALHNNPLKFSCHNQYLIELVYDGDFKRNFPNAEINTITVIYHNHTLDKYYNCELLQIQKKSRITYLIVSAD